MEKIRIKHYLIKTSALSRKLGRGQFWLGNKLNNSFTELTDDVQEEIIQEFIEMFIYLFKLDDNQAKIKALIKIIND